MIVLIYGTWAVKWMFVVNIHVLSYWWFFRNQTSLVLCFLFLFVKRILISSLQFNPTLHLTFVTPYGSSQVVERRSLLSSPLLLTTSSPWPVISNLWRREQLDQVKPSCLNVGCGAERGWSTGPAGYTLVLFIKWNLTQEDDQFCFIYIPPSSKESPTTNNDGLKTRYTKFWTE